MDARIEKIRESERMSHTRMYCETDLYSAGTWLNKPIRTVQELLPVFADYTELSVLDLGCGIGRNSLAIADACRTKICTIDCVDILDTAIEKLNQNAENYGLKSNIKGIVESIESFKIKPAQYDLIMAISALEHVDSETAFLSKLKEIRRGIRKQGIVCLIANSEVSERNKDTGESVLAQFEVNLPSSEVKRIFRETFSDWEILKESVREQYYEIPREFGTSELRTRVVTLVARNTDDGI